MQLLTATMQLLVTEHVLEDLGFLTKFGAKDLHTFAGDKKQRDDEHVASSTGRFARALMNAGFRVTKSTRSPAP